MKGVVFAEFLDWIEQHHGVLVLDRILLDADLAHGGAYTSAGTYDWSEFRTILAAAVQHIGRDEANLLRDYGRHLFGVFARQFPDFVGDAGNAFQCLARIESLVHSEVAKLHGDAQLPRFTIVQGSDGLTLDYDSPRRTAELARGLIEGCLAHFATPSRVTLHSTGDHHRLAVELTEASCPATR